MSVTKRDCKSLLLSFTFTLAPRFWIMRHTLFFIY